MKQLLEWLALSAIYLGRNVRIPGLAHIEELYQDIKTNGLKKPPLVFKVNDKWEVIQGHLRIQCIDRLSEEEPSRYKELFPDGKVQCLVLSDCSYEQAQLEKLDHGQENPLMHPMEVQLSMNMLFDQDFTEQQVAVQLSGLMQRVTPMRADTRNEIESLRKDVEMYRENERFDDIPAKERQIAEKLLAYHKGKIQNCKAIWMCPHIVMATMWVKATGGERNWAGTLDIDIPKDTYLPTFLQVASAKKLAKAFADDLKIRNEKGVCPYNKRIPGPNFNALWEDICTKSQNKEQEEPTVREKALSKAELKTEEANWMSTGFRLLCQKHRRVAEVDPNQLADCDKTAYFAEILAERAPTEWSEALKLAKGLEKEMEANLKEVEAAKKAPKPLKATKTKEEEAKADSPPSKKGQTAAKGKTKASNEPAKVIKKGSGKKAATK